MIGEWMPEDFVTEIRAADAAARAARAVPGVVRLQPGVLGLIRQLAAQAFEQVTGQRLPDIAGVQADLVDPDAVRIELRLVVDGGYQAGAVGAAVHDAVTAAVPTSVDRLVTAVVVHIVEVQLT